MREARCRGLTNNITELLGSTVIRKQLTLCYSQPILLCQHIATVTALRSQDSVSTMCWLWDWMHLLRVPMSLCSPHCWWMVHLSTSLLYTICYSVTHLLSARHVPALYTSYVSHSFLTSPVGWHYCWHMGGAQSLLTLLSKQESIKAKDDTLTKR